MKVMKQRRDGVVQRYKKKHFLVFVYGTLKKGFHNSYLLSNSTFVGDDRVNGVIYDIGTIPVVDIGKDGVVYGEVYRVSPETLAQLDRLEGIPSFYERGVVISSHGRKVFIYHMSDERIARRHPDAVVIDNGTF